MNTATGSEDALDNDTFAASVTDDVGVDPANPPVKEPPVKEAPVKEPPTKAAPVAKEPPATDPKAELDNPNLKPVEIKKEEEVDQDKKPEGMKEATWIDFKKVRGERNDAQKERDLVKAEVETLKKQVAEHTKVTKELEEARKELTATKEQLTGYESEITVTRVEATPKFKQMVTAPQNEIRTGTEEIAKRYEVSPDVLMRAIQETDPAKAADLMEEVISDFKQVDRTEMVQMRRDWQRAGKQADELRKNAGAQLESMTREQKQAQERAATQTIADFRSAVGEQFAALQERVPVIRRVDGQDKWNAHLEAKIKKIEAININDLEVSEVAKMAAAHEALPEVQKALEYIQKDRDDLKVKLEAAETRLAKYKKTDPGAGAGVNGGTGKGKGTYVSFEDAVEADA